MTASLIATAAALAIGLPIIALGERIREREERRLTGRNSPLSTLHSPERTSHEQVRIV